MKRIAFAFATVMLLAASSEGGHAAEETSPFGFMTASDQDWSGFYAGIAGGYNYGRVKVFDVDGYNGPPPFSHKAHGIKAVVQSGYNWWFEPRWLIGAEGELGYFGFKGHAQYPPYVGVRLPNDSRAEVQGGLFASFTGRIGVTAGPLLFFGKAGVAAADMAVSYIDNDPTGTTLAIGTSDRTFRGAFTGGGGIEIMFNSNLSARVEYDHYDFGTATNHAVSIGGTLYTFNHKIKADSVIAGLTYHW